MRTKIFGFALMLSLAAFLGACGETQTPPLLLQVSQLTLERQPLRQQPLLLLLRLPLR
ncbi:hypothetical protein [Anabaena sp. FACHB-709]|uniref:hypothetical protein n=1 Tax=Anabaena sp. FACHB-709 TaxID=1086822 RepID=UPI00168B7F20|nr:hypothetical protein [Anabaena sp. FACHB-709]MBD2263998.1 hypothetical protein [Anabaena sp. FACHB-709]